MATTINASNGSTSGLIQTGDASGVLQLQVNNGTPALTLNTTQALGVGTSPSYGTSGQVLQSTGSGSAPTWTTPSSGAMTLISTLTASSSASLAWTGLSGYDKYMLVFQNFTASTTNPNILMQLGTGAGPTYLTTGYTWVQLDYGFNGSPQLNVGSYAPYIYVSSSIMLADANVTGTAGQQFNGQIFLTGFTSNNYKTYNVTSFGQNGSNTIYTEMLNGTLVNSTNTTAIKIYLSSGNIASGTASLYGISS